MLPSAYYTSQTSTHIHMLTCVYTCMYVCIYIYIHICVWLQQLYRYTYIHTYIHTYMPCHAMPCHAMPCHAIPDTNLNCHNEEPLISTTYAYGGIKFLSTSPGAICVKHLPDVRHLGHQLKAESGTTETRIRNTLPGLLETSSRHLTRNCGVGQRSHATN